MENVILYNFEVYSWDYNIMFLHLVDSCCVLRQKAVSTGDDYYDCD